MALSVSCKGECEPTEEQDYIIFGDFYGFCLGDNCIDYYKIQNGILYKDLEDKYPNANMTYQFQVHPLPLEANSVMDIGAEIDSDIYGEDPTIGSPDAMDQGGYYIEILSDGQKHQWRIDKIRQSVPDYLHPLCDSLDHYMEVLE